MNRFENRTALITAAATGLGEAGALRLAREGARVTIWDRDQTALETAQRKADDEGLELNIDVVDMLDRSAIQSAVQNMATRDGRIDVLVNNIGGSLHVPFRFLEQSDDDWNRVIDVNITACV